MANKKNENQNVRKFLEGVLQKAQAINPLGGGNGVGCNASKNLKYDGKRLLEEFLVELERG